MAVARGDNSGDDSSQASGSQELKTSVTFALRDAEDKTLIQEARSLINKQRAQWNEETEGWTWYTWLAFYIPFFGWIRTYQWKLWLLWDVAAGMSTAAMVIPQGMSYANLAGLPYAFGLYGAFVPCIVYAFLGSSRQLVVGPVAVTSILLANGLQDFMPYLEDPNTPKTPEEKQIQENYNHAAVQIAFVAGCFYTAIGILRLGWITNFLSAAVISGFMTGACVIIALSQVKYILGLKLPRSDNIQDALNDIFNNLSQFKWREFCMGMAFIFLLLAFQYLSRRYKKLFFLKALGPLTVCIISIALMNIFGWYKLTESCKGDVCTSPKIKPIGKIPSGPPDFTAGWWLPLFNVSRQMVLAFLICMVDICESISIAKALARVNKYQLNATQELRGLGVANLFGAMFNCYTTTGSFSRSAVNNSVGAKTPLANFVTGITIFITIMWITPVFKNMSQNVQGAIIIVGVLQLFDWPEFLYLWKINKFDWLVWVVACLCTLFLGVEIGIGIGLGVSLVVVIYRTAFPRITTLGRLPGTSIYRSIKQYPEAEPQPNVLILRIDSPIWFANVEGVKEFVRTNIARQAKAAAESGDRVRAVVLDLSPVTDIDATGIHFLEDLIDELRDDGIDLVLGNPAKNVLVQLKRAALVRKIGRANIHINVADAVNQATSLAATQRKLETVDNV
ncbi:sulfate transporter [Chlorella sorokiniana]|uniref:Sulfate transporter n=1 Tax=Chlorella sorokiniana TaxID=3076 RepID=A0A2P6TQC0_CHLSO|nr:sulfate transporter [Chlorella sorokiniana]|eukprot:PRW56212.1 sulfate transporter [Chlorella sorokiniana]